MAPSIFVPPRSRPQRAFSGVTRAKYGRDWGLGTGERGTGNGCWWQDHDQLQVHQHPWPNIFSPQRMRLRKLIVLPIALAAAAIAATYAIRNPERANLDAAARQGVPGKFITLGDGITHYDVAGPDGGQRVMLVHGFSVPSYIWDSTVTALTGAGFRVARYDTYGRGYSDRPDVAYNTDLFDRQLTQLLDSLGWREPIDVVGLSMGGPVSAEFVGRHPERARSLTLVDPAAGTRGGPPAMFRLPALGL